MKIEYAVPCRGIEALVGGTYVAIGIETNAYGGVLPQRLAVLLLTCLSQGHPDEDRGELTVRVLDPQMEQLGETLRLGYEVPRSPLLPEGWSSRIMLPIQVFFEANTYGGHSIEMSAGAASLSVPFLVFEAPSR